MARVTRESNALELEVGVFTSEDPHSIVLSLQHPAAVSRRCASVPFRSALQMLVFYVNSVGSRPDRQQKAVLEAARAELPKLYERI